MKQTQLHNIQHKPGSQHHDGVHCGTEKPINQTAALVQMYKTT